MVCQKVARGMVRAIDKIESNMLAKLTGYQTHINSSFARLERTLKPGVKNNSETDSSFPIEKVQLSEHSQMPRNHQKEST